MRRFSFPSPLSMRFNLAEVMNGLFLFLRMPSSRTTITCSLSNLSNARKMELVHSCKNCVPDTRCTSTPNMNTREHPFKKDAKARSLSEMRSLCIYRTTSTRTPSMRRSPICANETLEKKKSVPRTNHILGRAGTTFASPLKCLRTLPERKSSSTIPIEIGIRFSSPSKSRELEKRHVSIVPIPMKLNLVGKVGVSYWPRT